MVMVFYGRLNDSKSLQIFRTLLSILVYYFFLFLEFFTPALADDFHRNLCDNKSPQISWTLQGILSDLNDAVVWMVSVCFLIYKSSSLFTNPLEIVPSVSVTVGITVTFMLHSYFSLRTYLCIRCLLILYSGLSGRQSLLFGRFIFYLSLSLLLLLLLLLLSLWLFYSFCSIGPKDLSVVFDKKKWIHRKETVETWISRKKIIVVLFSGITADCC